MTRENCPGTNTAPLPLVHLKSGWPYGGECPECHGFYSTKNDGNLRAHKPHTGDNAYAATERAELNALRDRLHVDPVAEAARQVEQLESGETLPEYLEVLVKPEIARRMDIDTAHCSGCEDKVHIEWLRLVGEYDE